MTCKTKREGKIELVLRFLKNRETESKQQHTVVLGSALLCVSLTKRSFFSYRTLFTTRKTGPTKLNRGKNQQIF